MGLFRREDRRILEFLRGTDILIMDTQYDRDEYRTFKGWGHGCLDAVVALALQAEVKRLFLFHHDPDHDDAMMDKIKCAAETARPGTIVATEGLKVDL